MTWGRTRPPIGCARRSPIKSLGDAGSTPATSTRAGVLTRAFAACQGWRDTRVTHGDAAPRSSWPRSGAYVDAAPGGEFGREVRQRRFGDARARPSFTRASESASPRRPADASFGPLPSGSACVRWASSVVLPVLDLRRIENPAASSSIPGPMPAGHWILRRLPIRPRECCFPLRSVPNGGARGPSPSIGGGGA